MEREKEEQKKRTTITRRSTINYSIITVNREAAYYTPIATMPTEMRPCWNRISTYQQFSFLIDARSDCRDRAITISSVNRVMMILFLFLFCSWSLIGTTQHNTTTKISVIIEWKYYAMDTKEWTLALPEQFDINNFLLDFFFTCHSSHIHACTSQREENFGWLSLARNAQHCAANAEAHQNIYEFCWSSEDNANAKSSRDIDRTIVTQWVLNWYQRYVAMKTLNLNTISIKKIETIVVSPEERNADERTTAIEHREATTDMNHTYVSLS